MSIDHPQTHYPVLSQAILSGASAQLRNMATTTGQVPSPVDAVPCSSTATPRCRCNKREPGTGCPAITGSNRTPIAVLGTSEHCIATNPIGHELAMAALEAATVHVQGPNGTRAVHR